MTETGSDPAAPKHRGRRKGETDLEARRRIAAWMRYEMRHQTTLGQVRSIRQFAALLDLSHPHVARVLAGKATAGVEVLIALHRLGHEGNKLVDENPPPEFFQVGAERITAPRS